MEKVVGVYHKDCVDGTCAAAVLLRKHPGIQLFSLAHHHKDEDVDAVFAAAGEDAHIYLLDCTTSVKDFLRNGNHVTVLDHHADINEAIQALAEAHDHLSYVFDNERSGATLAWQHFFPEELMPEALKYVEDADLLHEDYGDDTRFVNNYLSMFRNLPGDMLDEMQRAIHVIVEHGKIITQYADKEIEQLVEAVPLSVRIDEHVVPAYNIVSHQSPCGVALAERVGRTVALYTIKGELVRFSFRSKEGQEPTSLTLATALGGGGHVHSAGATIPFEKFLSLLVQPS